MHCSDDPESTTTHLDTEIPSLQCFFFSGYGDRYFTTSCNYVLLALFSISNMFHFYAWKWFSFKKKSCWHVPRYQYPQTIVSFHKSSKTRQQLREDVYKVIFVILLKKKNVWRSWERLKQKKFEKLSIKSHNALYFFMKSDIRFFKLMDYILKHSLIQLKQTKKWLLQRS